MTAPRSGQAIIGIFVGYAALMTLPLGLALICSGEPWLVAGGAGMSIAGLVLGGSAVQSMYQGITAFRAESAERLELARAAKQGASGPTVHVLAQWRPSPEEWQKFRGEESLDRNLQAVGFGCALAVAGTVAGIGVVGLLPAIGFSAVFSVAVTLLWRAWTGRGLTPSPPLIQVTRTAIHIGGRQHTFRSDMHAPTAISLDTAPSPAILEIRVGWVTREGPAHEEIRVPVPVGMVGDVRATISVIEETHEGP